uniref:Uncharacterized protein n=1 Tax=Anguilla anguilla TaxID=7936 RepID=A0A0E9P8E8_ANGAN
MLCMARCYYRCCSFQCSKGNSGL